MTAENLPINLIQYQLNYIEAMGSVALFCMETNSEQLTIAISNSRQKSLVCGIVDCKEKRTEMSLFVFTYVTFQAFSLVILKMSKLVTFSDEQFLHHKIENCVKLRNYEE